MFRDNVVQLDYYFPFLMKEPKIFDEHRDLAYWFKESELYRHRSPSYDSREAYREKIAAYNAYRAKGLALASENKDKYVYPIHDLNHCLEALVSLKNRAKYFMDALEEVNKYLPIRDTPEYNQTNSIVESLFDRFNKKKEMLKNPDWIFNIPFKNVHLWEGNIW